MDKLKNIKVVVVDDSPFSITILSELLTQNGFEVVGDASSLEETIDVVTRLKPDVVTMDMTIPGTDGLECTREIHKIDPAIKVIIVSSMMDDEIVRKAKKNKASGYIQKPADPEELTLLIRRIMANDELFKELDTLYYTAFKEAVSDTLNKLTKTIPSFTKETNIELEHESHGICVVIGIIGKYSGRMLFDMSFECAENLSAAFLRRAPKDKNEILNVIGEFSNIVAGNACSLINRKNKLFGLRVAPPTMFHGELINVSNSGLEVTHSSIANTNFGSIYMNIGFVRGSEEWMSNM